MNVSVPPAIRDLALPLTEFFEAMLHKLNVNSHKKAISEDDIDGLLAKMGDEIDEFREQRDKNLQDPNSLMELVDTANFAFLLFAFLRARGVKTAREEFIEEYLRIDPDQGRIYCKKTRSGSPYGVGDEIRGTGTPARLRTQHAVSGATISLLRRDMVWWQEFGVWPQLGLKYKDPGLKSLNGATVDCIDNLVEIGSDEEASDREYPFVSRYVPKGRETAKNFGRFVYQRRHALQLVRVGYWDSAEEAARLGLIAWKDKTRSV